MDADQAAAQGYIAVMEIRVPNDGEPVQTVYPLGGRTVEDLLEDAIIHFNRFWEHGPELDDWGVWRVPDFDGTCYQLMTREVVLPDLDFLDSVDNSHG
ncbi:hypothetical protein EV645_3987 [Kribbella rubisoli]|uniref:Uncharacterized protein n=1 Tax=Kribbella rubisoli TaxID=3075929 RepID=A0A4Q7X0M0_9ACTN|nr:hypothetical protein [Kribbella rubisoli]RZU16422.1 hypothetical protein EV645_3987 [Kribbella rubisoli]